MDSSDFLPFNGVTKKSIMKYILAFMFLSHSNISAQSNDMMIRIAEIEIYANRKAYESHLKTPHFQQFKTSTLKMVKSLKLINMNSIDAQTMVEIFRKIKH